MLRIVELIWDDRNEEHIAKHNVRPDEVEEVSFSQAFAVRVRRGRYRLVGQTHAGRYIVVILASRGRGRFYVVTARDATETERSRFRSWRGR